MLGEKGLKPRPYPSVTVARRFRFCIMPVDWSINCWFQKDSRPICSWVCTNTVLTRNYWYKLNLYSFTNRVEWAGHKNCRSLLRVSYRRFHKRIVPRFKSGLSWVSRIWRTPTFLIGYLYLILFFVTSSRFVFVSFHLKI